MVKLVDVAKAAGVSRGTASNAFTHPERVRPKLRERVKAAARSLGYHGPDPKGRLLRGGKVNAIGVISAGWPLAGMFADIYGREFMRGVAEACDEVGASMTLIPSADEEHLFGIRNALVDGFIVQRAEDVDVIAPALGRRLPVVVLDVDGGPDTSSVRIDDRGGATKAAQHLVDLGHRRFAILSVLREIGRKPVIHRPGVGDHLRLKAGMPFDQERLDGFASVLAAAGIRMRDVPIVEAWGGRDAVSDPSRLLFEAAPEATAVLTMSDTLAIDLLVEAGRRGIDVPGRLSVVGFDDVPEAAHSDPPLTTVVQPSVEKGRLAARLIFEGGPPRHEVLPVDLVVRQSTAPPPG